MQHRSGQAQTIVKNREEDKERKRKNNQINRSIKQELRGTPGET